MKTKQTQSIQLGECGEGQNSMVKLSHHYASIYKTLFGVENEEEVEGKI